MNTIRLILWNADELRQKSVALKELGYQVIAELPEATDFIRQLTDQPPEAFVIDLNRIPSRGRDLALHLRKNKNTRHVPLLFVGGEPEKVASIRNLLPDAVYSGWNEIEAALTHAIAHPPMDPVVHSSVFASYSGTPLVKKLGIRENLHLVLIDAPDDVLSTLGQLPTDVRIDHDISAESDLVLWFVRSEKEMQHRLRRLIPMKVKAKIWIIWPKKGSKISGDLSQPIVRQFGLANGLVDFKVCAVDADWTGLCFVKRVS